jgi:hypothetical protein
MLGNQSQDHSTNKDVETTQRTQRRVSNASDELNKAKRKSNAFLAVEAVQQERDVIKALKRLSMGGSLAMDPDLPAEYELQDYQKKHQRKRRTSGSSHSSNSSQDDENDRTLIEESIDDEEDTKIDTERLLWVPAKSHPSIAPDQFKRHVQSTLDEMTKKLHNKTKQPIPSLKELSDELDKLTEMAGLAATDAVTLARSLSSASSSSLIYDEPSGTSDASVRVSEDELDQDAPLFADSSNTLKRNKWTTYTRRNRMDRDKSRNESLLHDNDLMKVQAIEPDRSVRRSPIPSKETQHDQRPLQQTDLRNRDQQHYQQTFHQQQYQQYQSTQQRQYPQYNEQSQRHGQSQHLQVRHMHRSVSSGHDRPKDISNAQLQRSQSDITALAKKTNHARNRHAGSVINLDSARSLDKKQLPLPPDQKPAALRKVSPLTQEIQEKHRPQPIQLPPTQESREHPVTPVTQEPPESLTPIDSPKEPSRDKRDSSKSKDFLNLFKMKRSPSPKTVKDKKAVTPTRSTFDDENTPILRKSPEEQQQKSPPKVQKLSPQRPSLKPSLKFNNDDKPELQRSLQESVKVVPRDRSQQQNQQKHQLNPKKQQQQRPQQQQPFGSNGMATSEERHRVQKESLARKLSESSPKPSKPNAPVQFTDSAFGFPLPPLSQSTMVMLDHRFPVHVERALYRLSHLKLANPRRQLRQQVLLSNFMYAYLNLVNHTLYLQQLDEERNDVVL